MKVAFYAPLKSPDHPVPSGDRQIARGLLDALRITGHDTRLASRFRSFDGRGDALRQARLRLIGRRIAERLVARYRGGERPELWFTYHLHHKAPDLLGPAVSRALDIPYVVAEASLAPRQRDGPWATGHAEAFAAIRDADIIVSMNPADVPQVRMARAIHAPAELLAPFVDVCAFAGHTRRPQRAHVPVRLITVAMMREGAKLASYRTLATALSLLRDLPWTLQIIGDGPSRIEVAAAFAPFAERVQWLGALPATEIASCLRESDLFVWPAVDEAFGLAFIEAQACGLPVVGADSPGVAAVVSNGRSGLLAPAGDAERFAAATRRLLDERELRERMASDALAYVRERHDLPAAAARLDLILKGVLARRRVTAEASS